jgi:hypothetical protein
LKLEEVSKCNCYGVERVYESSVYIVDVILPNKVKISGVHVTSAALSPGFHVLIGMDIIGLGSFGISNFNNRTTFTFKIPSEREIDLTIKKVAD